MSKSGYCVETYDRKPTSCQSVPLTSMASMAARGRASTSLRVSRFITTRVQLVIAGKPCLISARAFPSRGRDTVPTVRPATLSKQIAVRHGEMQGAIDPVRLVPIHGQAELDGVLA